jgi:AcrR family transcriptional regulator
MGRSLRFDQSAIWQIKTPGRPAMYTQPLYWPAVYIVHMIVYTVHMSKDKILNAARTVLEQEGIAGLSARRIAQRSGMSPMSLYRHFADKDALLNALMADGLSAWEERVRSVRVKAPLQWIERVGNEFLAFAMEEPHRFDAAFLLPAPKARRYPDDFSAGRSPVIAMTVTKIDEAKSAGLLGDMPALDVALTLSALAQGLVSMHRARRFASDAEFSMLYRSVMRNTLNSFSKDKLKPK